ncbi:MAG: type II toxin-antitoxin system VapC family toxin [Ignavibacteriaceae bacterium]|jgi:PIN domain nuclease of toxin-antitoxin system
MNYLLDTHMLIWYLNGDKKLSDDSVTIIDNTDNKIYVSIVGLWEIAIKISLGKLKISIPFEELKKALEQMSFDILELNFSDLLNLQKLAFHHSDPFDRLLIAQAISNDFVLISHDEIFRKYPVSLIL